MRRMFSSDLPLAPTCSLPPCGGGLGRGVETRSVLCCVTPLPVPPPQGGRERWSRSACRHLVGDSRHIAAQNRRQISIHHRGVAAADQLDQRRDFVADRDLGEAHLARKRRHRALVLGIAVGVHEHDRHRLDAVGFGRAEIALHGGEVGRFLHRAVGAHALVDFGHALIEHVGLDDLAREDFRPRLVADLERVAEPLGDQQQRALALALEQRIGGNGSAHLHRADLAGRDRLAAFQAEQVADALHRGVGIGLRVFRQQLVRMSVPSGRRPTRSVKVPPRSIQKSQALSAMAAPRRDLPRPYTVGGRRHDSGQRRSTRILCPISTTATTAAA